MTIVVAMSPRVCIERWFWLTDAYCGAYDILLHELRRISSLVVDIPEDFVGYLVFSGCQQLSLGLGGSGMLGRSHLRHFYLHCACASSWDFLFVRALHIQQMC